MGRKLTSPILRTTVLTLLLAIEVSAFLPVVAQQSCQRNFHQPQFAVTGKQTSEKIDQKDVEALQDEWTKPLEAANKVIAEEKDDEEPGVLNFKKTPGVSAPEATKRSSNPFNILMRMSGKSPCIRNENKMDPPGEALTGLKGPITIICANIAQQIYYAKRERDFNLQSIGKVRGKPLFFDNHGDLNVLNPAFVAAYVEANKEQDIPAILILGWRGSQSLMDWFSDFTFAPVFTSRWGGADLSSAIRAQGTYSALMESDLSVHKDEIAKAIEKHDIQQVVFTGHSLAGGMAQMGHLFAKTLQDQGEAPWNKEGLTLKSLAFAGPTTLIDYRYLDENNTKAEALFDHMEENHVNVVFERDIVPRGYSHINYIREVLDSVLEEVIQGKLPFKTFSQRISRRIAASLAKLLQGYIKDLVPIMMQFRHLGKIIYYDSEDAEPIDLVDSGPRRANKKPEENEFCYYKYNDYSKKWRDSQLTALADAHMWFPEHFATYILPAPAED